MSHLSLILHHFLDRNCLKRNHVATGVTSHYSLLKIGGGKWERCVHLKRLQVSLCKKDTDNHLRALIPKMSNGVRTRDNAKIMLWYCHTGVMMLNVTSLYADKWQ